MPTLTLTKVLLAVTLPFASEAVASVRLTLPLVSMLWVNVTEGAPAFENV